MSHARPARHSYLDSRVATSSQAELQLMMLEAALRFGRQARQLWNDEPQSAEVDRLLRRGMDVVQELIRSVMLGQRPESRRLEEEYAFVFRQLTSAFLAHDARPLDSALKLLDFHRETWRLACEKLKSQHDAPAPHLGADHREPSGFSLRA
jgi:flagellar protein FliS